MQASSRSTRRFTLKALSAAPTVVTLGLTSFSAQATATIREDVLLGAEGNIPQPFPHANDGVQRSVQSLRCMKSSCVMSVNEIRIWVSMPAVSCRPSSKA